MGDLKELEARAVRVRMALLDANTKLDEARENAESIKRFLPAEFFTALGQAREGARTAATLAAPRGR